MSERFKVIYHGESDPLYFLDGKEYEALGYSHGMIKVIDETGDDYLYDPDDFEIVKEDK